MCIFDQIGAFFCGHVDDVEPAAGDFSPFHGSLNRLGLDEVWSGDSVETSAESFHLFIVVMASNQLVENSAAFCVNEKHRIELFALFEGPEYGGGVGLDRKSTPLNSSTG